MGSSESTRRTSNGTKVEEEEEHQPENNSSGGGLGVVGVVGAVVAMAAAGTVVLAVCGLSKMLSNSTDTHKQQNENAMAMKASSMGANYQLNSRTNGYYLKPITWCPPPPGRFKMNTDGAARTKPGPGRPNTGPSGYGGILRDDHGQWVRGFRGFIGESDCLTAEFHGILKGLELLDILGLKESILESDCTGAIDWILSEESAGRSKIVSDCWGIITECRRLVKKNRIDILYVGENGNKCADKLAKMAIDRREKHVDIINLPDEMKHHVNGDISMS